MHKRDDKVITQCRLKVKEICVSVIRYSNMLG